MASFLFLLMAIGVLDAPVTLFSNLSSHLIGKDLSILPHDQPGVVSFRDFGYLPYCFLLTAFFVKSSMKNLKLIGALFLVLPIATYYHYYTHRDANTLVALVIPTAFYAIAILLFFFSNSLEAIAQRFIKLLIGTGAISYGLYIVHYPLLSIFGHSHFFSGTALTFGIRLLCFAILSVVAAYFLEKRFQPWIRSFFFASSKK